MENDSKKHKKENKNEETQSMESWFSSLQVWEIKTHQHPLFISSTKFSTSSLALPTSVTHIVYFCNSYYLKFMLICMFPE